MNQIEKIEWIEKNKEKLDEIFTEPIIFGILEDLHNEIQVDAQQAKEDSMTKEEEDFINNAFLGANPLK